MTLQLDDISLERLMKSREWTFGNIRSGDIFSPKMALRSGGRLQGYSHPNEASWRVKSGAVELLTENGMVSARFDKISQADGRYLMEGRFRLGDPENIHFLREGDATVVPENRTALIVPIHDVYFIYGINLLYQSIGADYDIIFVFSTDADRKAFAEMHQASAFLNYHAVVLDDHFSGSAISMIAERKTWPTVKKFLALSLAYRSYDYILCVDAETFILNPTGWTEAAAKVVSEARWYCGSLTEANLPERQIMYASSMSLAPDSERANIQTIAANWSFYTWWWDIPVYATASVGAFLKWIEWDTSLQFVERFGHTLYDHVTYQFYMALHGGFSFVPVAGITHSLEFSTASTVSRIHNEVNPLKWANAFAYSQDPNFFKKNDYLAVYHIDRKTFPQFNNL